MRKILKLSILLVFSMFLLMTLMPPTSAGIQDPYTICGTVFDTDGETVVANAVCVIKNLDTDEANNVGADTITGSAITVTTDSSGKYTFELINLNSGYSTGDNIKVTATKSGGTGSKTHTVTAGGWGAVVNVVLGEEEGTTATSWWDTLLGMFASLCFSVWGWLILIAILIGIWYFYYSGKPKKRR